MKKLLGILGLVLVMTFSSPVTFAKNNVQVKQSVKININTATAEQLSSLKGIGTKKAEAIVAFRKTNGNYKKAEDIMLVKGIGEKMFAKIKGNITVK